jgi:predicted RNA-binding Zn-ribbon protein involved in translation (DUF1610 family)
MTADQRRLGDAVRGDLALTDRGYRNMVALGMMPQRLTCPDCGGTATFREDRLAARYECLRCGHAVAAMYADPCVAGTRTLQ